GNYVKLAFEIVHRVDAFEFERMWVVVTDVEGERFRGELRNDPTHDVGAVAGDSIVFGPEHILFIAEDGDEVELRARLMQGVIVRRRVFQEGARPGLLERREPIEGTRDSGWLVFAGDEEEGYFDEPENYRILSIGDLYDESNPTLIDVLLAGE